MMYYYIECIIYIRNTGVGSVNTDIQNTTGLNVLCRFCAINSVIEQQTTKYIFPPETDLKKQSVSSKPDVLNL